MIAKLSGRIDSVGADWMIVDVGGVGYMVFASRRTLGRVAVGQAAAVLIDTHVREDHIHLYGFADAAEQAWFRRLTTVQGVGARVALNLLSAADPDALTLAILAQDKAALVRADGVGPKLAVRILSELKDKVDPAMAATTPASAAGSAPPAAAGTGAVADATSALVNLGYDRSAAFQAAAKAAESLGDAAAVTALIPAALALLSPVEAAR